MSRPHKSESPVGAGLIANEEGPTVAAAVPLHSNQNENPDCHDAVHSEQALHSEGADYARAWLDRLSLGTAQPGELSTIVSFLNGEMLAGACDVIEQAVVVRHG
jgi:hypothetical protein